MNTILYNVVDNKTKNEKFLESDKMNNNNNNLNNEDELINKSLEEEHIFEKKKDSDENKEKGENDSVNYDFDDGDNIIDIEYDKI